MIRWLAFRAYNRLDAIWLIMMALAWRDGHYFAAFTFCIAGGFISGFLEAMAKDSQSDP